MGGYDRISEVMANYVKEKNSQVNLGHSIKKVLVKDRKVTGVELSTGEIVESDCVIISYPAYHAINQLFDSGIFDDDFFSDHLLDFHHLLLQLRFASAVGQFVNLLASRQLCGKEQQQYKNDRVESHRCCRLIQLSSLGSVVPCLNIQRIGCVNGRLAKLAVHRHKWPGR